MEKVGIYQSEKAGVPVTLLPERGCLCYLAVNKEREATSIARINPLAIYCDVAAEYSDFATFFFAKRFECNHHVPFVVRLKPDGYVALLQQISPMLTGQRALSFFKHGRMRTDRDGSEESRWNGVLLQSFSECKDTPKQTKLLFSLREISKFAYKYRE